MIAIIKAMGLIDKIFSLILPTFWSYFSTAKKIQHTHKIWCPSLKSAAASTAKSFQNRPLTFSTNSLL
jgi:hypothetical protein